MSVALINISKRLGAAMFTIVYFSLTTLQFEALSSSEPTRQLILEVFTLNKSTLISVLNPDDIKTLGGADAE
jgi:hypothetical protein